MLTRAQLGRGFIPWILFLMATCTSFSTQPRHVEVQVEPLQGLAISGSFTTVHPRELPRCPMHLQAHTWTGPTHDNLIDALKNILASSTSSSSPGFAVLTDPDAMFRVDDSSRQQQQQDQQFPATWFQTLPTRPDTTTIPYTEWLPRNTHHDFARHLHGNMVSSWKSSNTRMGLGETYAGILSIGGVRRRGGTAVGDAPNLSFPHQDECKFSVLMGEYAAVAAATGNDGPHPHPLDGVSDTVSAQVKEGLDQTFLGDAKNNLHSDIPAITCRQINFWCPHEKGNGDKYLVVMSRQVSQALVEANLVTTCQLPRFASSSSHIGLNAVNCNYQLSDRAVEFIAENKHLSNQVYVVNRPVVFISHETRYDGSTLVKSPAPACQAVFHCGATLQDLHHVSTEMRLALFSVHDPA